MTCRTCTRVIDTQGVPLQCPNWCPTDGVDSVNLAIDGISGRGVRPARPRVVIMRRGEGLSRRTDRTLEWLARSMLTALRLGDGFTMRWTSRACGDRPLEGLRAGAVLILEGIARVEVSAEAMKRPPLYGIYGTTPYREQQVHHCGTVSIRVLVPWATRPDSQRVPGRECPFRDGMSGAGKEALHGDRSRSCGVGRRVRNVEGRLSRS